MSVFNRGTNIIIQADPSFAVKDAIDAADRAEAAASGISTPYPTRAAFLAANVPPVVTRSSFFVNGNTYAVVRDATGPIVQGNGQRWRPDGDVYPEHMGDPSLAETWTAALAYSGRTGCAVKASQDEYTVTGTIVGDHLAAFDFENIVSIRRATPGAPLYKTVGFDSYADGTARGYTWYQTTAARNAASRPVGSYAMVAPTQTDWFGATWWECIASPSNVDAAWVEVEPVSGQVGGLYRNVRFDGGASTGDTDLVCGIYGFDVIMDHFRAEGGGIVLHTESPGAIFSSQVNRNAMWSIHDIEVRKFSKTGWIANHQSDGSVYHTVIFAPENVVATLLHVKSKCSGTKWIGGHTWGGLTGTDIILEGASNMMVGLEHERTVRVKAGGLNYFGYIYRINDLSRDDGAAFIIDENLYSVRITGSVNHFRHCVQFLGTGPGPGTDINLTHYSQDAAASGIAPGGPAITTGVNDIKIIRTGSGASSVFLDDGRARNRYPRVATEVPYAASVSLDFSQSHIFRIGQLTGPILVEFTGTPSNGDQITVMFTQDVTGGRTVSWGANIRGGFTDSGAGYFRRVITFTWHGAVWVQSSDSGAWQS